MSPGWTLVERERELQQLRDAVDCARLFEGAAQPARPVFDSG